MGEIYCFDKDKKKISYFTQWDINQKIYIKAKLISSGNFEEENLPMFHYCSSVTQETMCVSSSVEDDWIVVDVPNILLEDYHTIIIYVYGGNISEKRTLYEIKIPIKKRQKPGDYVYENNVPEVKMSDIMQQLITNKSNIVLLKNNIANIEDEVSVNKINIEQNTSDINSNKENINKIFNDIQLASINTFKDYLGI